MRMSLHALFPALWSVMTAARPGPARRRIPGFRRKAALISAAALGATLLPASDSVGLATTRASDDSLPPSAAAYLQQEINWGECSWWDPIYEEFGYKYPECARITVPRDWAHPGAGPDLKIAISRVRAGDPANRRGILATNPGGPGGSGVQLPVFLTQGDANRRIHEGFDVIGMDPRGVGGRGTTALNCYVRVDDVNRLLDQPERRDLSPTAVAFWREQAAVIADACAANPLTQYINTWQTAHDVNLVRALLGERKLNYLGYSYGSWLGAKFAALFPRQTDRMVLDSNTAWMDELPDTWELQPLGFHRRFMDHFAPWALRQPEAATGVLGKTPADVWQAWERFRTQDPDDEYPGYWINFWEDLMASLMYSQNSFWQAAALLVWNLEAEQDGAADTALLPKIEKMVAELPEDRRVFTIKWFESLFGTRLDKLTLGNFRQQLWENQVPRHSRLAALQAAAATADGQYARFDGVFEAIRCGDGGQWHNEEWHLANTRRTGPKYPLVGYRGTAEVCNYWKLPTKPLPDPDPRKVSIATVQSELDPATPYESTRRNVAEFRTARLISVDDDGDHALSLTTGNPCVDDAVSAYLADGADLPRHTVCTALPMVTWYAAGRESQVYPVDGPVDGGNGKAPKPAGAAPSIDELRNRLVLNEIIGSTGPQDGTTVLDRLTR